MVQSFLAGWVGKSLLGGFVVLTSARYGVGLYFYRVTEKLERPTYQVLKTLPTTKGRRRSVEIRRYDSYLIAETEIADETNNGNNNDNNDNNDGGTIRKSTGDGFRTCAGYIFGKNISRDLLPHPYRPDGGEKMAMTAPVRTVSAAATTKISFVVSPKYTLKTAPKPLDPGVRLRRVPPHTLAVSTFAGPPPKDGRVREERRVLEEALGEEGVGWKEGRETLVYGYHDPFLTPNFLRRNEVAVVVEGSV